MFLRPFILGTLPVSFFGIILLGTEFWLLRHNAPAGMENAGTLVLVAIPLIGLAIVGLCHISFLYNLITKRELFFPGLLRRSFFKFFVPFLLSTGRLCRIPLEEVQQFLILINNRLVAARPWDMADANLLVLLPHCLQQQECNQRISLDVRDCAMCGGCDFSTLRQLAEEYNLRNVFVASGGSIARELVGRYSPTAIVAVACETELITGLTSAYPVPVLAIPNLRPVGPCMNTRVPIEQVKDAIDHFIPKAA